MKKFMPIMLLLLLLVVVASGYAWQGVAMHNKVASEEVLFHQLQQNYFLKKKSIRDRADTGSELNKNLVAIKNYPSELMHLKLVGVGKILAGIFILLFAILIALLMMPVRLGMMINKKK